MGLSGTHRRLAIIIGVFLAVALILSGVWILRLNNAGTGNGTAAPPPAGAPAPTPTGSAPGSSAATMTVKVYFHRGSPEDPGKVVSLSRTVPRSPKVATAALTQLLAGPTRAERRAGYWSFFSDATSGDLRSVRIKDAVGYADFHDYRDAMPSATSGAGSAALLAELDATFRQFGNVARTVYSFDGDVPAFYEWLQLAPPVSQGPTLAEAQRVARAFLTEVAGMRTVQVQGSRWRSDFIATVDVRAGSGPGPVSTVTLGKGSTSFSVLAVTTDTIVVERPAEAITPSDLAVVTSPMTMSGRALAFEGNVAVRVVEVRNGTSRVLGRGNVTGGGDIMRPFTGEITFAKPATGIGWVIAGEHSARDGRLSKVTAVRVAFVRQPA